MSNPADASRIHAFADGTPEGLRSLVELFIRHTSDTFSELRAAAPSRPADVQMLAHRAAGAAGACGATLLTALLREVEASAKARDMHRIDQQVAAVQLELARVHAFLTALLEDSASNS